MSSSKSYFCFKYFTGEEELRKIEAEEKRTANNRREIGYAYFLKGELFELNNDLEAASTYIERAYLISNESKYCKKLISIFEHLNNEEKIQFYTKELTTAKFNNLY